MKKIFLSFIFFIIFFSFGFLSKTEAQTKSKGLLNSSSGLSCEQYCLQEKNLHCASIGTDLAGTNGDLVYYNGNYARCYTVANYTCSHVLFDLSAYNKTCVADAHSGYTVDSTAHSPQWTYCKCFGSVTIPTPTATPIPPTATPIPPTVTPPPGCECNTDNTCATVCAFDKFAPPITYTDPIKCSLPDSLFYTVPSAANKTAWCQANKRTEGDANGDDVINTTDYFYYVAAKAGAKIPANVNPDFNGDGNIAIDDRAIIRKVVYFKLPVL
jgi:hypothetical protein